MAMIKKFFTNGRWIEIENIQDTGDGLAVE